MGPRAAEGPADGSPGPPGTPASPSHGRREGEGQSGYREPRKDSDLSLNVQKWCQLSFPTPLGPTGAWAGASLHLVKFKEGFLKNKSTDDSLGSLMPVSQSMPSFSSLRCPRPTQAQQLPAPGPLRVWCPHGAVQSRWGQRPARNSRAGGSEGDFPSGLGRQSPQHAQPQGS